ncbi:MAG: hypothetical protein SGILL_007251, partial [Bacillariaceae sp.]
WYVCWHVANGGLGGAAQVKQKQQHVMPKQLLAVDPNSSLAADIDWMEHVADQFIVQLAAVRKCHRPVLVGRLSGPTLALVQWTHDDQDDRIIVGTYQLPSLHQEEDAVQQQYHVEIIVERCEAIAWHDNFANHCLENPYIHRLTMPNATIQVHTTARQRAPSIVSEQQPGMWARKPAPDAPLLTRTQPVDCRRNVSATRKETCDRLQSLDQFQPYDFHWNAATQLAILQMNKTLAARRPPEQRRTMVCYYGMSHSHYLTHFSNNFIEQQADLSKHVAALHLKSKTAVGLLKMDLGQCDKVVIGVGQWEAGFPWLKPTLLQEYQDKMRRVAKFAQQHHRNSTREFYFRSMHPMPIGDMIASCPPT